jgi:hexosaminidase
MELFPSEYIHIGGDEAPKYRWDRCDDCQARIAAEGLADSQALQSWFITRIEQFLNAHGRKLIGWDEILEGGLSPNATVQSWRGMQGAISAAQNGHDAIVSPTSHAYFDYPLSAIDMERVYGFEPVPSALKPSEAVHIIGGECNMWTEHAPQHLVEGKLYPRILAMAEALWTPTLHKEYRSFSRRVQGYYPRLDSLGVSYGFEAPPVRFDVHHDSSALQLEVKLVAGQPQLHLHYINAFSDSAHDYAGSILLQGTGTLSAFATTVGVLRSDTSVLRYDLHAGLHGAVTLDQSYSNRFTAGGAGALIDGLRGSSSFRDGYWQGYEGLDVVVTLDLGTTRELSELSAGFLQDRHAWIFMPRNVAFSTSLDGISYVDAGAVANTDSDGETAAFIREFKLALQGRSARYVRMRATSIGQCPEGHPAAGGTAWLFIDELVVR